jgi:asparagine synthase (glutamine-hydrolysing)
MCGIVGLTWSDSELITRMTQTLNHRGPDQSGIYTDSSISLGHRRLSILDLSEHGLQPMSNQDKTIWISFNGEIYNFKEIRRTLEDKGFVFHSHTDTEVILYAYEAYGMDCLELFNGMFAFAIWDQRKQELILARDRLGIKPLYYYSQGGKLIFSSEIKAIIQAPQVSREINPQALYHYVGYEFVPAPETIFKNINKLPPGSYLRYREGDVSITHYWNPEFHIGEKDSSYYEEEMLHLLEDSVRQRLISDVPLGVFLSGGLDSSAVVAMMDRCGVDPIQTFALGYEDPTFSELDYAEAMSKSLNTKHHVLMVDPITPELMETAVWHLDEPMTDLSTIPFYLICKKAREHVTVCLSGEGGDEVLVGYDRFKASKAHSYYSALLPKYIRHKIIGQLVNTLPDQPQKKGAINVLKRFIQGGLLPEDGEHMRWQYFGVPQRDQDLFAPSILAEISRDPFAPIRKHIQTCNSTNRLDREIYLDLRFTLPDSPLMKVDKMSMAHGLEVRVPFLDHRFVEFCATIPSDLKLNGFTTKSIFRSAMKDVLPPKICNRGKQGYSLPIKNWLRQELNEYMVDLLNTSPLMKEAFNLTYIQLLIREHLDYKANHNHILWALINLALWHRMFIEAK